MSDSRRSKRIAVLGAVVALVALLLVWWQVRDSGSGDGDEASATARGSGVQAPPLTDDELAQRRRVPPRIDEGPPAEAPIIDSVTVEKESVCQNEENLITVVAHTPGNRDDAYLHGVIGGKAGLSVPINDRLQEDGSQPEPRKITVFGRGNVPTTIEVPRYEIKECMVDRKAIIAYRVRPNTDAEFDIGVRIMDLAATTPFEPARFEWKFGDGETAVTDKPWTEHSYDERDQGQSLYSEYLIQVRVTSTTGETLLGRRALVLRNSAYSNLVHSGIVTLSTSLTPRFPELGDDGVVRQQVKLWHHRPDPVTIERITLRTNYKSDREPTTREASVSSVLGQREIPPFGVTVAVELDTGDDPDVFSVDYMLEGVSAEGLPVRGVFPIMTPGKLPTREDHIPVRDPELTAKIIKARELLGKEFVTDEEIWALERDGAFDDLVVPDGPGPLAQQPTYADVPPHPPRSGEPGEEENLPAGEKLPVLGREDAPDEPSGTDPDER